VDKEKYNPAYKKYGANVDTSVEASAAFPRRQDLSDDAKRYYGKPCITLTATGYLRDELLPRRIKNKYGGHVTIYDSKLYVRTVEDAPDHTFRFSFVESRELLSIYNNLNRTGRPVTATFIGQGALYVDKNTKEQRPYIRYKLLYLVPAVNYDSPWWTGWDI